MCRIRRIQVDDQPALETGRQHLSFIEQTRLVLQIIMTFWSKSWKQHIIAPTNTDWRVSTKREGRHSRVATLLMQVPNSLLVVSLAHNSYVLAWLRWGLSWFTNFWGDYLAKKSRSIWGMWCISRRVTGGRCTSSRAATDGHTHTWKDLKSEFVQEYVLCLCKLHNSARPLVSAYGEWIHEFTTHVYVWFSICYYFSLQN